VPVSVWRKRSDLALPGAGMSIVEISHRSKMFEHSRAGEATFARWRGFPPTISPVPAGRSQPAILDGADEPARRRATADYIDSGSWAEKAIQEAKKVGTVAWRPTKSDKYTRVRNRRS
jgi:phosphoserine aminotransferase